MQACVMNMKTTKTIGFFYPKKEQKQAYFQIQIMKQNKQT
jgi:hypothetical protein